ncbi:hypothetical protein I302_101634 [Kwoniella bestiolae CBS 10118]|uniref:Major facilitator superfamily (MFS) profile domain-containing protein n=1 Tax=Kwoniella bestiolae CBS 10118 TaxID=1296100 RepID=A0A1B9GCS7_9TREE|nr:hypothetical protein I302_00314 [Kwoniella bestiolae CBS 10118]OCF28825.1 hypothetical protein I302_00314 [Kwoniella bestiolae CBS 10118]
MASPMTHEEIPVAQTEADTKGDVVKDDGINVLINDQQQDGYNNRINVIEHEESAFVGMSRMQALRVFWRPTLFCYMCAFSVVMNGYQDSLPGGLLANAGFIKQFGTISDGEGGMALDAQHISVWSGVAYVAQFVGCLLGGVISDRFGRKIGMHALTLGYALGVIVEMVAKDWRHWLAAKLFTGLGGGLAQGTMLSYMNEISPAQIRGYLLSTYGAAYAVGQLFIAIALQIVDTTDPEGYLKAVYSEWVVLGPWIIMSLLLPESPWHYARQGREDLTKELLNRIYKGISGYDTDREYAVMVMEIEREKEARHTNKQTSWKDILVGPNLKRTFAGVCALAMQNWVGSSVVFNYTTYFFQQAGIPQPFQANVIVYCILIGANIVSFYLVERAGRRSLILYGGVASAVLCVIIGTMGVIEQTTATQSASLAVICMWVVVYALCFAGTGWLLAGEISTPRLRAKTASFIAATNAIAGTLYNTTVPLMLGSDGAGARNWGLKTLYMFAILSAVGTVLCFFLVPETKGRTFNELDEMYEAGIAPRKMKKYITRIEEAGLKVHSA